MTPSNDRSLHLHVSRGHALRDVAVVAAMLLVVLAFVTQAVRI